MKTFNKMAIIFALLMAALTLSGCGPILQHGIHAMGPETENGIYHWLGRKDPIVSENYSHETPKDSFLNQCLMSESHTPDWCIKRAEEAFSKAKTEGKKIDTKVTKKTVTKTRRG